jgi:3-oxoacyl-[acyl-carrier-protein] synthase II
MATSPSCLAVITGIGCVSPFGIGGHTLVTEVLRANRTAIGPITGFALEGVLPRLGAEVPASALPEGDETRRWGRLSTMTVTACRQAVADAGLHAAEQLAQTGLVVGSEFGDLRSTEAFGLGFLRKGPLGLSPLLFPNTVMNAMAGNTSIALGLKGPMLTLNQHGVAGEAAVTRAVALIRAGRAPAVIACGVDELFPLLHETLALLHVPSPRDRRTEACYPFDQRHNGAILGEGATAIVLESPAHAQARGAPILAEVRSACWGSQPARPHRYPVPTRLHRRVLDRVLAEAAVSPAAVEIAYLSGCGDPQRDEAELAILVATFGPAGPLITSVTPLAGEYGSLGALRVAAATATVQSGELPRLDYLRQPIRGDVRFAMQPPIRPPALVLVHGLGRGGGQTALLLGRPGNRDQGEQ